MRIILVLLFFISAFAQAEKGGYGGIHWGIHEIIFEDFADATFGNVNNEAADANFLGILVGYKIWDYLGIEVRGGIGLGTYDFLTNTDLGVFRTDVELKNYISGYLRPEYQFEKVILYPLLGYSTVSLETESGGPINGNFDDSGFSWGFGIGLLTTNLVSFNLEYMSLIDTNDFAVDGLNVGMEFRL